MSHALITAWNNTLRRHGARRAIVQAADGREATFRELDVRSSAWRDAHGSDLTRRCGRAVVFAVPNGIGWMEMFLGLLKAGAVVVPLDAGEPPAAQRRLAESLRAGFWWDGAGLVPLEGARSYRDPEICLIKLTSGSTGAPRPLVFTAGQLLADAWQVTTTMGINARDLNHALIPFGHSYGLGSLTIPLLAQGVPVVCGTSALPHAIAADFARWKPTVFPGVPAIWRALAAADSKLEGLRLAVSAGAPLPPETARDFAARHGRRLHSFYGSSETGGISYDRSGAGALSGRVGRAMRGVRLELSKNGRLHVSSAAVVTFGRRRRKGRHGRWLMPDVAEVNRQGDVTLRGRRDAVVKIGGRRVTLAEVAARLRLLRGVGEVWVGVSAETEPVLGAAVVSARPVVELRAELQADTPPWKIPKRWAVLSGLPLSARGKVDAAALRRLVFSPLGR